MNSTERKKIVNYVPLLLSPWKSAHALCCYCGWHKLKTRKL